MLKKQIQAFGKKLVANGVGVVDVVAVDKSMTEALGPKWHKKDRKRGEIPEGLRNVDVESGWGFSAYRGWVQGYSWHLVCSAARGNLPIPLLADVEPNNVVENKVFDGMIEKIAATPWATLAGAPIGALIGGLHAREGYGLPGAAIGAARGLMTGLGTDVGRFSGMALGAGAGTTLSHLMQGEQPTSQHIASMEAGRFAGKPLGGLAGGIIGYHGSDDLMKAILGKERIKEIFGR